MAKENFTPLDVLKEKAYIVEFTAKTPPVLTELTCRVKVKVNASTKEDAIRKALVQQAGEMIGYSDFVEEIQQTRIRVREQVYKLYKMKKLQVKLDDEATIEDDSLYSSENSESELKDRGRRLRFGR